MSKNIWNKVASLYQSKFMNLSLYDDTYDAFLELIKKGNSNILDIGCGPGNISKYILKKRPDLKILGIDYSSDMIDLAKNNIPAAIFKVMNINDIGAIDTTYDALIAGFCLPYLHKSECANFIKNCTALTLENGFIYMSFIKGNYLDSGFSKGSTGDEIYVNYYSMNYIKNNLEKNGFKIVNTYQKTYFRSNTLSEVHLIVIGKKVIN